MKKLGEGGFGVVVEAKKKVDVRIFRFFIIIVDVRMKPYYQLTFSAELGNPAP